MTLRKMSTKVLSVFLAMIMIVALWAPAVSAAGHDHGKTVEITYTEEKAQDYLNAIISAFLGDDTFFTDYTVGEDSYYLAIGDDVAYATVLAGKLGLTEAQYGVATWDGVDAADIAKADLITVGYSESMISGLVADVMNGDADIDWAPIVGEDKVKYIDKAIDYVVKAIYVDRVENNYSVDLPEKETVKNTIEAYFYGYLRFAKDYTDLMQKIVTANPDATIVLLGNPNAFADLGLEITFGDITIDLAKYLTEARKDAVNDKVNELINKLNEFKGDFMGNEDIAADMVVVEIPEGVEIPDGVEIPEGADKASLKDYINENLRDYIESFTKDGAIDKEALIKDVVETHGSIGDYIAEIEEDSGYTIEEWEDTLKEEISEELKKDEEFVAKVEEAIAEDVKKELEAEFGENYTEEQYEEKLAEKLESGFASKLDEMVKEEVDSQFEDYRDEIDAATKVKDVYVNTIAVYEENLYNLINELIAMAEKANGIICDVKSTFEGQLFIDLLKSIDPEMVKNFDWASVLGEDRADYLKNMQNKVTDKILDELYKRGWIEDKEIEITVDLIYENLEKLDAKTREWLENFDKGDVTKILGGAVVYSEKITTLTEKGLKEFNKIYDGVADYDIVIKGATVDVAKLFSAPSSVLSLFYAGAIENVIFVDISAVETGLNKLGVTGMDVINAYVEDTTVANATEAGNEYIAQQICDALGIVGGDTGCTHVDANKDHKCDLCGAAMGAHIDANKDHNCDYGCSEKIGDHTDADKDHNCDYGCSEKIGVCEDADLDHKCDYGCSKTYGEHVDADKNHKCDYGCSEKIGAHEDVEPVDHMCDYCGQRMSTHKYGKWQTTKEATKKEEGEKVRTCTICGHNDVATIPCLEGLSTGAIIAIVIVSIIAVGGIGFAIYWFGYRKQMLFKKKGTKTLSGK
jgi:hypothetical protein